MAKQLHYIRGKDSSVLELLGHNGRIEKRLVVPKTGLSEPHNFDLGTDGIFVNKSAVSIQVESFRDFEAKGSVVDYEDGHKRDFVLIDTEYCGTIRFIADTLQAFEARFLSPENDVPLHGELTLLAAKTASA